MRDHFGTRTETVERADRSRQGIGLVGEPDVDARVAGRERVAKLFIVALQLREADHVERRSELPREVVEMAAVPLELPAASTSKPQSDGDCGDGAPSRLS